jgi:uncharacterized protein YecT (DUF1311 family)
MSRITHTFIGAAALIMLSLPVTTVPAMAQSFDCAAASTALERAICENAALGQADIRLAKAFATALGGLTKEATAALRTDQREWLDFANRACTDSAMPMTEGDYDADGGACLVDVFTDRATLLEASRMLGGHRFTLDSAYAALPDPMEAADPGSYWRVATHSAVAPLLDFDDELAQHFNAWMAGRSAELSETMSAAGGDEVGGLDPSADTDVTIMVEDVAGIRRITMSVATYWFGHGAAHGNWSRTYLHYLIGENRELVASDIFSGDDWQGQLVEAAWAALQEQHGEWLQVESADDIAESVIDPTRWDLSNDYGLVIQFQPYEVSAYAYGGPTVLVSWDRLDAIKADTQDDMRWGW